MGVILGYSAVFQIMTQIICFTYKILEMKDGRIAAIGDLDDIIKADPEMYEEIKQVAAVGWDDNRAESAEEERHILQQMVSKISLGTSVV